MKIFDILFNRTKARATGGHQFPTSASFDDADLPSGGIGSIKDVLGQVGHETLLKASRALYKQFPLVRGTITEIARNTVGGLWNAQYVGDDVIYRDEVESFLKTYYDVGNVLGFPFTLPKDLELAVIHLLRDGEVFLVKGALGKYPAHQWFEADNVCGYNNIEEYKGYKVRNGIAYNSYDRPVMYHFCTNGRGSEGDWVEANKVIHYYDPEFFSQGRGISPIVYALLDTISVKTVRDNIKVKQRIETAISIIEKNVQGAPDDYGGAFADRNTSEPTQPKDVVAIIKRGMFRFLKFGENIEPFKTTDTPNSSYAEFEKTLLRGIIIALGWTYESMINGGLAGTDSRHNLARNQRTIEARQRDLERVWRKLVIYVVAFAYKNKRISNLPDDWTKLEPQLPKKLSVDVGRDRAADIKALSAGAISMIDYIRDNGEDEQIYLDKMVKWYKLRNERAARDGVPIEIFGFQTESERLAWERSKNHIDSTVKN